MADREGNVLRPPGMGEVAEVKGDEILGSYARFTQKGLTLKADSGVLEAGTVLKMSSTSKKYDGATAANVGAAGTGTVVGVLRKGVDTTGADKLANYVPSGVIKASKLKWADGTPLTDAEVADLALTLNGSVDKVHNYLIL